MLLFVLGHPLAENSLLMQLHEGKHLVLKIVSN